MWTQEQLDKAHYVAFYDQESRQPNNVGTIEPFNTGQSPYLMTPAPPFGSLTGENTVAGLKHGVKLPIGSVEQQFAPRGLPVPSRHPADQFVIHEYGNGTL